MAVAMLAGVLAGACSREPDHAEVRGLAAGLYKITSVHSGKCVDAPGLGQATQRTCSSASSQLWTVRTVTGGVQIVSSTDATLCLKVANASRMWGDPIVLAACSTGGAAGEVWNPVLTGNNYELLLTHDSQCLDVSSNSKADGAGLIQWICSGNANQKWTITLASAGDAGSDATPPPADAATDATPPPPADAGSDTRDAGTTDAGTTDAGSPVMDAGTTDAGGGAMDAGAADGGAPPGAVQIESQHSSKCLDVVSPGAAATQQTCGTALTQRWVTRAVTGGIQIVSAADATRCLSVANASRMWAIRWC